eukprot:Opistho-1_new@72518
MTAMALTPPRPAALFAEFDQRHPLLTRYGFALLALGAITMALQIADPRTLASGVNIWVKPAKFFVSVGVFALTTAWFMGYVQPERRNSRLMRLTVWALIASGSFELLYISFQAAQGLESHFNLTTPFSITMYALPCTLR